MSEFTKGPWRMLNVPLVNKRCHQIIGPVTCKTEISDADAYLIAAAPDMYDALLRSRATLKYISLGDNDIAIKIIADAIKKADGGC